MFCCRRFCIGFGCLVRYTTQVFPWFPRVENRWGTQHQCFLVSRSGKSVRYHQCFLVSRKRNAKTGWRQTCLHLASTYSAQTFASLSCVRMVEMCQSNHRIGGCTVKCTACDAWIRHGGKLELERSWWGTTLYCANEHYGRFLFWGIPSSTASLTPPHHLRHSYSPPPGFPKGWNMIPPLHRNPKSGQIWSKGMVWGGSTFLWNPWILSKVNSWTRFFKNCEIWYHLSIGIQSLARFGPKAWSGEGRVLMKSMDFV